MAALSDNMRGAGLMMASMAAFTLNDACMKAVADELPLFQATFLRGVLTSVLLYVSARALGLLTWRLPRQEWGLIAVRTLAELGAAFFFLSALFHMPIANVSAILQALPLTVTLAGALFLGEAVGWRRFSAILIGFAGVLMIVRPGAAGFNAYSVFALIAVVMVTVRDLAARRLSANVSSVTVALIAAFAVTLFAAVATLLEPWAPVSGTAAAQLGVAAVLIIGGYVFSVSAMRVGEIAMIAAFRYTSLIWALVLGFAVFAEWPDRLTLSGAAIVVMTGIYTFYRERRLAVVRKAPVVP